VWPFNFLFGTRNARGRNGETGEHEAAPKPVAHVRIDRHDYPVVRLDRATLTVTGFTGDLIEKQHFQFSFCFELDGEPVEVPTRGTVLKLDGGRLEARYFAPQPYYQRLMRRALAQRAA
jgi:hypothetical protein